MRSRIWSVLFAAVLLGPVSAGADVVLDWNAITATTIRSQNPFAPGQSSRRLRAQEQAAEPVSA